MVKHGSVHRSDVQCRKKYHRNNSARRFLWVTDADCVPPTANNSEIFCAVTFLVVMHAAQEPCTHVATNTVETTQEHGNDAVDAGDAHVDCDWATGSKRKSGGVLVQDSSDTHVEHATVRAQQRCHGRS